VFIRRLRHEPLDLAEVTSDDGIQWDVLRDHRQSGDQHVAGLRQDRSPAALTPERLRELTALQDVEGEARPPLDRPLAVPGELEATAPPLL
jgi:hypothetical protein